MIVYVCMCICMSVCVCMSVYDCMCTSIHAKNRKLIQARDPCQKSSSLPHLLREANH